MNIPLIFRHPQRIKPGSRSEALIGQYDLPVTLLDYLDIDDVQLENSPGRSFAGLLRGKDYQDSDAVFFEQEETRVIRTGRYSYWKRLRNTGKDELYDLEKDPGQHHNVAGDPAYASVVADLDSRLEGFYKRYADPEYDLWNGGIAKGSVDRPEVFQELWGEDWRATAEIKPEFKE